MPSPKPAKPLPDRWDDDVRQDGKLVLPDLGPKVGIHWGHLLMLEKHLRDIQRDLRPVIEIDRRATPGRHPGDGSDVAVQASETFDHAVWLERQVRGLRTGDWPAEADERDAQGSPPRRLWELFPFLLDDPDVPF